MNCSVIGLFPQVLGQGQQQKYQVKHFIINFLQINIHMCRHVQNALSLTHTHTYREKSIQ